MTSFLFLRIYNSSFILKVRSFVAYVRGRCDPWYICRQRRIRTALEAKNAPYEREESGLWYPSILSIDDTLRRIIDRQLSVCRYGDGEFEIVNGQKSVATFQLYDVKLRDRLREILANPIEGCLCCFPNIYGSLSRYPQDHVFGWRRVAVWSRERIFPKLSERYKSGAEVFGDALISRVYLGLADKSIAPRAFRLWKELFKNNDILLIEGRYSRLGVGNDLFEGAKSVRRIWCPATNAFSRYDEILTVAQEEIRKDDLVLIALGMTATILAYDLAKNGFWAIDVGHIDIEYMWMQMGANQKVPIPGRYVNECAKGHEHVFEHGEIEKYHVVRTIGC